MQNQLSVSRRFSNNVEMFYRGTDGKTRKISRKGLIEKVRNMTFYDYYKWFIANEKEGKIRGVTLDKYLMTLKWINEIAPDMLLIDLESNRQNLQFLLDEYGKTHQRATTMDFRTQLGAGLGFAVDDGYIHSYAKTGITIHSIEDTWTPEQIAAQKQQIKSFSATQFNKFKSYVDFKLDAMLDQEPIYHGEDYTRSEKGMNTSTSYQLYYMLFAVLIHTGVRYGEAMGFEYSDITPGDINISKTWKYRSTVGCFQPTKNRSSIRLVTIDNTLYELLKKYYQFKEKYGIPNDPDRPLLNENVRIFNSTVNNLLASVEKHLGLPRLTAHKLRHSYASYLLYQDIPAQIVAKQLGHTDTSMLFKVYAHILEEKKRASDEKIKGLLA